LAVVVLFVSMLSSLANETIQGHKKIAESEKSTEKPDSDSKYYFNKTTIEAVFSQVANTFQCETVVFLISDFKFLIKESKTAYLQIFAREIHLEILFEHLSAPNAP
jgi:hypothetical protein